MPGSAWAWRAGWLRARSDARSLWAGVRDDSPDAPAPVALGALPFRADEVPDALWQGLMPGGRDAARAPVCAAGRRAWWRLTLPERDAAALPARLARERSALAALATRRGRAAAAAAARWRRATRRARYAQAVTQAVECIRRGELVKVVLARRGAVAFDRAPSPAAVLARLGARHPDCVRYAWRRGGKTWLGATPETLVRVDGRTLHTDALAGTRTSERAAELLVSARSATSTPSSSTRSAAPSRR